MSDTAGVASIVEELWVRFQPLCAERVTALELYAESRCAGHDTAGDLAAAEEAAHKLSGSLGSYGRHGAGVIARDYELALTSSDNCQLLRQLSARLRAEVGS
jgi:hypothetical protein